VSTEPGPTPAAPHHLGPDLLEIARGLAESAGRLVEETRREAVAASDTKSSATDHVTAADRAAERIITEGILAVRPTDAVLGEEDGVRRGTSGVRWVIDPIDGTTNYLYDLPAYAVSIAAEHDGRLVAGVVHDPRNAITFAASLGGGATRNGRPIRCSGRRDLATALVGTGFSYRPEQRERQARLLVEVLPRVRDIRRFGAAALDLCAVACGQLDAYYEHGLNHWDLAAGWLIAAEAGAVVGDLRGGPPSPELVVAAPPDLFDALVELLATTGAHDLA
jgi:myo-inositol-1(or 4)-monophosphatase